MRKLLLALGFASVACVPNEFDDVLITSASIDVEMVTIMTVIGGMGGDGVLTFTKADGTTGSCNVGLRGPMFGAAFMFAGGFNSSIGLSLPAATIPLSDVFGVYSGTGAGGGIIIGGQEHNIKNNSDVSIDDGDFVFGIGGYVDVEFLRLSINSVEDCVL